MQLKPLRALMFAFAPWELLGLMQAAQKLSLRQALCLLPACSLRIAQDQHSGTSVLILKACPACL